MTLSVLLSLTFLVRLLVIQASSFLRGHTFLPVGWFPICDRLTQSHHNVAVSVFKAP
jgi:hypothetical protein